MNVTERFLNYVAFDTTSDEESTSCPSTARQLELGRYLADELKALGLSEVRFSDTGYVYAVLPASAGCESVKPVGFVAHMDTSPAVSGADIHPRQLLYTGGDIPLNATDAIRTADFPFLENYVGQHLIVTDGTTLLGADDKAGAAEIITMAEYLLAHPECRHGKISIAITPDEEVGRGTESFDLEHFDAEYAYTVDGGALGELEYENFNAAGGKIIFNGVSIHPGSAKNKMKNAVLFASEFISMLPAAETPAHTEGYEGFYHIGGIEGNETRTTIAMIIRDHDRTKFEARKAFVSRLCDYMNAVYGEGTVVCEVRDSYFNMKEKILPAMYVVEKAEAAMRRAGVTPKTVPIRGGTDGAALSYRGLPCPNLSTGGENFHGVHEFVSVEAMEKMVEVLRILACCG